jgi:flagellar biosynthetic protein FliR
MELVADQMLPVLYALWWPFCRVLAFLSAAPIVGDGMVPLAVRVPLSVLLAVVLLPATHGGAAIDPFSLNGVMATVEQAVIGGVLGLAFELTMAVVLVLGFMVSSQMGLSMAVMNDPMNGQSSDVISSLMVMLCTLVFFAIDGHLVLVGVVGQSFRAWPVGSGLNDLMLQTLSLNVAWVFSASMLLALPMIFSTLVVQVGIGFLNRVAPSLNLFSLGFAVITSFGLFMLVHLVRFVPDHYVRLTGRVLDMLQTQMHGAPHG